MYKGKLQELSHEKRWGLPRYTVMKDGPDHHPRFTASVCVNGLTFDSPTISTSSKEAHNQAAKQAFLHFTNTSSGQNIDEAFQNLESHLDALALQNCSSKPRAQHDAVGLKIGETYQSTQNQPHASGVKAGTLKTVAGGPSTEELYQISENHSKAKAAQNCERPKTREIDHSTETHSHSSSVRDDLQYQYKSQLQNYARRKNLDAPLYSSKSVGPPHALLFKASVTVDGQTFESPKFFNTTKKSHHDAAKVALMSLWENDFQEEDGAFYKNILDELAQEEFFCIPAYETVQCGPSHLPTFFSTVEVDGEIFRGKAGKSKKQAEIKAAKAAFTAFKDGQLRQRAGFTAPDFSVDEVLKSSAAAVDAKHNHKPQHLLLPSTTIDYEEHSKENKDETQQLDSASVKGSTLSSPAPSDVYNRPIPANTGKMSYLLSGRVRVYLCFPDIAFPKGITVLPINDHNWVAISLDFPNENVK